MWVIKGIGLIMEGRLRVFTAFSGYDSQCMALDRLGMDYDLVGWSEIDRYAIRAHDAIYPRWSDRNYGDITRVDWDNVPDFDLFTMSSPCQDFSSAGLQRGGDEGSGTRSSLLWECRRAILAKKPKFILFENVKALVSKKFLPYFLKWGDELSSYGYTNFTKLCCLTNMRLIARQLRAIIFCTVLFQNNTVSPSMRKRLSHITKCAKSISINFCRKILRSDVI